MKKNAYGNYVFPKEKKKKIKRQSRLDLWILNVGSHRNNIRELMSNKSIKVQWIFFQFPTKSSTLLFFFNYRTSSLGTHLNASLKRDNEASIEKKKELGGGG